MGADNTFGESNFNPRVMTQESKHTPSDTKYHQRIFFVGICNKPGKAPLDVTTVSGKMVSKMIAAFPNDEAMQYEWIRTNLFDEALSIVNVNLQLRGAAALAVRNWQARNNVNEDDLIITLGDIVNRSFAKAKVKTCKLGHPSRMWLNADQKVTYLPRSIDRIRTAMADHKYKIKDFAGRQFYFQ